MYLPIFGWKKAKCQIIIIITMIRCVFNNRSQYISTLHLVRFKLLFLCYSTLNEHILCSWHIPILHYLLNNNKKNPSLLYYTYLYELRSNYYRIIYPKIMKDIANKSTQTWTKLQHKSNQVFLPSATQPNWRMLRAFDL